MTLLRQLTIFAISMLAGVTAATTEAQRPRPLAMVYRGPATTHDIAASAAALLESSPRHFKVIYAGPSEDVDVTAESLRGVQLYVQPGGGDDSDIAYSHVKRYQPALRDFVSGGGRFIGFCLGAYLAGRDPGFGLLPKGAEIDAESDQPSSQVKGSDDAIIQIDWKWSTGPNAGQTAKKRWIYFQEGAVIFGFKETKTSFVLGRYSKNQQVASTLNKYGKGWVGLIGPHPEADESWFEDENLPIRSGLQYDIGYDLIEATMTGQGPPSSH